MFSPYHNPPSHLGQAFNALPLPLMTGYQLDESSDYGLCFMQQQEQRAVHSNNSDSSVVTTQLVAGRVHAGGNNHAACEFPVDGKDRGDGSQAYSFAHGEYFLLGSYDQRAPYSPLDSFLNATAAREDCRSGTGAAAFSELQGMVKALPVSSHGLALSKITSPHTSPHTSPRLASPCLALPRSPTDPPHSGLALYTSKVWSILT